MSSFRLKRNRYAYPIVKTLKLSNGEEIAAMVFGESRKQTLVCNPMSILHTESGGVQFRFWATSVLDAAPNDSIVLSNRVFAIPSQFIIMSCLPMKFVFNEYIKLIEESRSTRAAAEAEQADIAENASLDVNSLEQQVCKVVQ